MLFATAKSIAGIRFCSLFTAQRRTKLSDDLCTLPSTAKYLHIANVVANGIAGESKDRLESKRLLNLLRELDDAEIIGLSSMLYNNSQDEDLFNRHANILTPIAPTLNDSQDEFDAEAVQELARAHLLRLGLFGLRFRRPSKNQLPEFDESTGMLKSSGNELTTLSRLLLKRIGTAKEGEF